MAEISLTWPVSMRILHRPVPKMYVFVPCNCIGPGLPPVTLTTLSVRRSISGSGGSLHSRVDRYSFHTHSWRAVFLRLTAEGILNWNVLLDRRSCAVYFRNLRMGDIGKVTLHKVAEHEVKSIIRFTISCALSSMLTQRKGSSGWP